MDMTLCAKTLGRRPGCVVMSIGAVLFDRTGKQPDLGLLPENQFYAPISALDSDGLKLTIDQETLKWWKKQPSWKVVGAEFMNSKESVVSVCDRLAEFIAHHKPEKIWSNSPSFHVAIVNSLFERVGKRSPIAYRQEMDFRTVMDLVYPERDQRPIPANVYGYPMHHAVSEGIMQARAIVSALKDINPMAWLSLRKQRWMMLDIETLGVKPGFGIMSIGAAIFGPQTSREHLMMEKNQFYSVINSFDMQNCGLRTDEDTLKWWKKEPIWKHLSEQIRDSDTTVHTACKRLAKFILAENPDKIWANSPSFDVRMLRYMFELVNVDFPVAYRQEMDFRTVMELAYPKRDNRPARELDGWFPAHHSLGDAMEQTIHAQKALSSLGVVPSASVDAELQQIEKNVAPRPVGRI